MAWVFDGVLKTEWGREEGAQVVNSVGKGGATALAVVPALSTK